MSGATRRERVVVVGAGVGGLVAALWLAADGLDVTVLEAADAPGGKLQADEDPYAGLVRELREELDVEVLAAERLIRYPHAYPERTVWLDMWIVTNWSGEPRGLEVGGRPQLSDDRHVRDDARGEGAAG